ncbi:hypothetical protein ACLOJK_010807 [Asimina triloba]
MPLLKNKEFVLAEPPEDLQPTERVWQVRFTKEIFRDYEYPFNLSFMAMAFPCVFFPMFKRVSVAESPLNAIRIVVAIKCLLFMRLIPELEKREYARRMHAYRRRLWKCKATGKIHLTYEEALTSEHQASEKIQQFPGEFIQLVLSTIQFSTVSLNELIKAINENLKESFVEGEELRGRNGNVLRPCRISKVLTTDGGKSYELGWLDKKGEVVGTSTEDSKNLARKKPFSRDLLKLFIRESTSQSDPWVIREELAIKHGISKEPPEITSLGKGRRTENDELALAKRTKTGRLEALKIKYPIDDLLVKPSKDDPVFSERPTPSTGFVVPMDVVGDILMVWNFCSSFSKILHLTPFSIEDFENGIVYEGPSNLIVEILITILHLLINYHDNYHSVIQEKKRREMITSTKWPEYLCDFIELGGGPNSADQLAKIKQGNYFLLSIHDKLEILGELVHCALSTEVIRWQLDKYIDELQALAAAKREDDLEEKCKEKELREMELNNNECLPGNSTSETLQIFAVKNKDAPQDVHKKADTPSHTQHLGDRLEAKLAMEKEKEAARMIEMEKQAARIRKQREERRAKDKEARERKEKEQRVAGKIVLKLTAISSKFKPTMKQHFDREMEKRFIRTDALGKDRNHNRYWFFHHEGKVFIESADHTQWGFYTCKEELDGLIASLNPKGVRELGLQSNLRKHYTKICGALQKRMKEIAQRLDSDTAILRRSVRVSVRPDGGNEPPFLKYVNKWRV